MKRLLLVDDDAVLTRAYRDRLSAHGFRVATAASGAGALSLLASAKPDLVVLDLMMPELTGVDVLKFVRGQPRLAATPVVVLANEVQDDLGRHAAKIGIQKAFRKDQCSPTVLMAAIDEILEPETSRASVGAPTRQAEPTSTPPKDLSKVDSRPAVQPRCAELKQASSLLQKGIEEMLVRESELASECTSLHGKVEELTRTLAQAHADAAREIKNREAAERHQAEQLTGLLTTLERERLEWQQKLKSSDDSCKQAKEQAGALSRLLQTQQAVTTALKKELTALELQGEQQERALSDARKEVVAEREARVAAEERAGLVEESLQTQWVERQELEQQIQAHAASLGSLLTRVTSKAVGSTGKP